MDWSGNLKAELRARAEAWAIHEDLPYYTSLGADGVVLFEPISGGAGHGNFHPASWQAITENLDWARRLNKAHSRKRHLPTDRKESAHELDSSNSSDALLMNCFCFPDAANQILQRLGLLTDPLDPVFGFHAAVELADGSADATEVDMKVGPLLIDAKLTERDFTSSPRDHVLRYRHLKTVFDVDALPVNGDSFTGYQLIRNVLAAVKHEAHFAVLLDQRRPDLLQEWWLVHSAIANAEVRRRCGFRTWQQVAAASPPELRQFLSDKYGL